jgi:Sulfotransferase domain
MSFFAQFRRRLSRTSLRVPIVAYRHRGLRPNDVFIASYPRSGSTWLRFLLFELVTRESAGFDQVNEVLADVGRHGPAPALVPGGGRIIKTHEAYRTEYRKAVYLVRDPRDVALSEYAYELANRRIPAGFEDYLALFLKGKANGYGRWHAHVDSWLDSPIARQGRLLALKFEDLRRDTPGILAQVAGFLGVQADAKAIDGAIANNSVQRMQAKEDRSPQLPGATGEQQRFIRSGSVGGWRQKLTADQARRIEEHEHDGLMRLGYALTETAGTAVPSGDAVEVRG